MAVSVYFTNYKQILHFSFADQYWRLSNYNHWFVKYHSQAPHIKREARVVCQPAPNPGVRSSSGDPGDLGSLPGVRGSRPGVLSSLPGCWVDVGGGDLLIVARATQGCMQKMKCMDHKMQAQKVLTPLRLRGQSVKTSFNPFEHEFTIVIFTH